MPVAEPLHRLCCACTKSYEPMLIRLLSGIKDRIEVAIFEHPEEGLRADQPGGGHARWSFMVDLMCQLAGQVDKRQIILFTDVDIEFYRPIVPELEGLLQHYDIVFQRETHDDQEVNVGVIAFRASIVALEFWEEVQKRVSADGTWDQRATNEVIADEQCMRRLGIRVGRLPFTVWNRTQGPRVFAYGKAILVHANLAGAVNKWNFMNSWRPFADGPPPRFAAELFFHNLHNLSWRFGNLDRGADYGTMTFCADGTIGGYDHPNERRYELAERGLSILDQRGSYTTFFDDFFYDPYRQKILATGRCPMQEGLNARHLHYLIGELAPSRNLVKMQQA